jgi:hypothetical protein
MSFASGFPGAAQLNRDFVLAGLRGVQAASNQEEVLYRRLASPSAQDASRFTGLGVVADQCPEDISAGIARGTPVARGEKDLDAVAGAHV